MSDREEYILKRISSAIKSKDSNAEVFLFGSHARGTADKNSDWDILILLNQANIPVEAEQELRHSLLDIELEVSEVISTLIYAKNEWDHKYNITPLYRNIMNEGKRIA